MKRNPVDYVKTVLKELHSMYTFIKPDNRINKYENNIPSYADTFRDLLENEKYLPHVETYSELYLSRVKESGVVDIYGKQFIEDFGSIEEGLNQLKIRAIRNFPSFIREIHLYALMVTSGIEEKYCITFIYSPKFDRQGYDFVIMNNKTKEYEIGIASYIDTYGGKKNLARKENSRNNSLVKEKLYLGVKPPSVSNTLSINGYWLHPKEDIKKIENKIRGDKYECK